MAQRGKQWGLGSVSERAPGRWRLVVNCPVDPVTGRRRQLTETVSAANRTEALRRLAEFGAEVRRTSAAGGGGASLTLREACGRWFTHAQLDLSPNTAAEFLGTLERYVFPLALADKRLSKVKASDLDALYRHLLAQGGKGGRPLSPATVRKVHSVLSLVFAQAVRWEWLAKNPASDATAPKVRRGEPVPPSGPQVRKLMAAVKEEEPDWQVVRVR